MSVTRRTRLSLLVAAASGALVVTMAGTALASEKPDHPSCGDLDLQDAQAALDAVAPPERIRLDDLCVSIPTVRSDDTEDTDAAPETTPAAAPEEEENADTTAADEDSGDEDSGEDAGNDDGDAENDDENGGSGDRDCADFDSQADAQAAFEENSEDDPERLDADDDGIACEDHFDTEGQQVAVHPNGGVATGGAALS